MWWPGNGWWPISEGCCWEQNKWPELTYRSFSTLFFLISKGVLFVMFVFSVWTVANGWGSDGCWAVNTKLFKLQHLTWGLLNCRLCCHYNQWSYPWVNDLSVNVADKAVLLCLWPRPLKWHLVAKVLFGRLSIGYLAWCVWSCSFLPYWISKRKLVAARKFLLRPLTGCPL